MVILSYHTLVVRMAIKQPSHIITAPSNLNFLSIPPPSLHAPSLWYGYQLSPTHSLVLGHTPLSQHFISDPPTSWRPHCSALFKYLPIGVTIIGFHLGTTDTLPPLDKLVASLQVSDTLLLPTHSLLISTLAPPPTGSLSYRLLQIPTGDIAAITSVTYVHTSRISEILDEFVVKFEIRQELTCQVSQDSFVQDLTAHLGQLKEELNADTANLFSVRTGTKSKQRDTPLSLPSPPPSKSKKPPRLLLRDTFPPGPEPCSLTLTSISATAAGDYKLPLHYHVWLPSDLLLTQLLSTLREGVQRYLTAITEVLTPSLPPCYLSISLIPHPLLPFLPVSLPHTHTHLITDKPTDQLSHTETRQQLNALLCLPPDMPYFFPHRSYPGPLLYLPSPHLSISHPLPPCYNLVRTVQGMYDYCHYMSGGFDDAGWGCAYRSLQTLFSWYLLQGYVKGRDTLPSHREIQESLVYLGDKPSSFVGSTQWIGSVEIGMVLQDMLGVDYKIIPLSSASELSETARQLLHHFEKIGTPVMIGGGQLAHTLLGCAYDESMGMCQLLVLDPHYRGHDELKTVLKGGWCAWKGVKFWRSDTFYNLCLPLRKSIL